MIRGVKVAVSGATGLIGSALSATLRQGGHSVSRLVRAAGPPAGADDIPYDPGLRQLDPAALTDVDAVVHLAGAGIGDRRWTPAYQQTLLDSRLNGTTTVSQALAAAEPRPRVLLSASAIGWYGDTGDVNVDERTPVGSGFLADLCRQWEAATAPAEGAGVRVVHLRTGLVCSPTGGLLGKLLLLYSAGLGGRLGSGRQYWSWISLADEVAAIEHLLVTQVSGPVNLTGPEPVQQAEFARTLGAVLHRPAVLPAPAFALRLALGGFADEGVLAGQRVRPHALEQSGFRFRHQTVEQALRWATGREQPNP